jgi:hypothetical protein
MKAAKQSEIVEEIVDHLGPLSCSRPEALAAVDCGIGGLQRIIEQGLPDAATTRKAAKALSDALALFEETRPIPLHNCERPYVTVREIRSACGWLQGLNGPSTKFDQAKWHCANFAYSLIKDLSKAPQSGRVRLARPTPPGRSPWHLRKLFEWNREVSWFDLRWDFAGPGRIRRRELRSD